MLIVVIIYSNNVPFLLFCVFRLQSIKCATTQKAINKTNNPPPHIHTMCAIAVYADAWMNISAMVEQVMFGGCVVVDGCRYKNNAIKMIYWRHILNANDGYEMMMVTTNAQDVQF